MKRIKLRIPGFTVIEVMVTLVLTALAMTFIFTGIRFVQRQSDAIISQLKTSGEIDRLYRALQTDARRASEVRYRDDVVDFQLQDANTSRYWLIDSICIRQVGHVSDTFRILVDSIRCHFVENRLETHDRVIDELSIYLTKSDRPLSLPLHKHYDVAARMRLTDSLTSL